MLANPELRRPSRSTPLLSLLSLLALLVAAGGYAQEVPALLYFEREGDLIAIRAAARDGSPLGGTIAHGRVIGRSPDGGRFAYHGRTPAYDDYVAVMSLTGERTVVFEAGSDEFVSRGWLSVWSPGNRLAVLVQSGPRGKPSLVLLELGGERPPVRHRLPGNVFPRTFQFPFFGEWPPYAVRWSPDDRHLLIAGRRTIVVDVASGRSRQLHDRPAIADWAPSGAGIFVLEARREGVPDMRFAALTDRRSRVAIGTAELVQAGLGETILLHTPILKVSPSGKRLAIAGTAHGESVDGIILLYDLPAGQDVPAPVPSSVLRPGAPVLALEWSPDETALALLAFDPTEDPGRPLAIRILDLASGEQRTVARPGPFYGVQDLDFIGLTNTLSWSR
jgi:WD40 repeat protein